MRQVVFTDVLIVGRLDVDGQNFTLIGLHKMGAASDWLYERLAGSPVTKLIGLHKQSAWFSIYRKEDV